MCLLELFSGYSIVPSTWILLTILWDVSFNVSLNVFMSFGIGVFRLILAGRAPSSLSLCVHF